MKYLSLQRKKLEDLKSEYEKKYKEFKSFGLKLDMSRGKPSTEQLDLSIKLLDVINSSSNFCTKGGFDCRNYGLLDGIPEAKELFANLLGVKATNIFVGGNSSLNLMFDTISHFMFHGINDEKPWIKQEKVKFLCPSPGYDRHFAILDYFNIEPIVVPMTEFGPNMEIVEENLAKDESIKGIWCVPKYANPTGASYSNETVRRLAALRPKAKDLESFGIMHI